MWHKQMSHLSLTNLSFCTYKWVVLPIQTCHVAHTNESWHTYKWVTSHMQMSHVAYTIEWYCLYKFYMSRCVIHIDKWVMAHLQMSHVAHANESCRIYKRVILPLQVLHVEMRHTNRYLMSRTWISRVTYMDETHTWMKHTHGWIHIQTSDIAFTSSTCRTYKWVTSLVWMSHIVHRSESCPTYEWVMSKNSKVKV